VAQTSVCDEFFVQEQDAKSEDVIAGEESANFGVLKLLRPGAEDVNKNLPESLPVGISLSVWHSR
jgi:hypothetical protein